MAKQEHLDILDQGDVAWNRWSTENTARPDLRGADLRHAVPIGRLPEGASGRIRSMPLGASDAELKKTLARVTETTSQQETFMNIQTDKSRHTISYRLEGLDLSGQDRSPTAAIHRRQNGNYLFELVAQPGGP